MNFNLLLAATPLDISTDSLNEINTVGLFFLIVLFLGFVGLVTWYFVPIFITRSRYKRSEKAKAEKKIWFNSKESVLHCGHNKMRIEPKSLEHFICKLSFKKPDEYHEDIDIFYAKDHSNDLGRGVEQAVRRLNKKAKGLGLKDDLFKRGKESTSVNDMYRTHIESEN